MDIKLQLQRLLDLADETRHRTRELSDCQLRAASELDSAEYDLRRLVEDIYTLLDDRDGLHPQPNRAGEHRAPLQSSKSRA